MRRLARSLVVLLVACGRAAPSARPVDPNGSGDASEADAASVDAARDAPSEAGANEGDGIEASAVEAGESEASGMDASAIDASPQEDADAGMNDDSGTLDAGGNDGRAPTTADNPPVPTGYKLLSQ